jgi:TRAP transporter 4TM/12TM fusion protein
VLLAIAGLSLPFKAYDGSHRHIPWRDWIFAALAASFSLYLLVFFDGIFIQRPGQHTPVDLMIGVIAIAMVIEATRRTMGIFLPLLAVATVLYGIFGPYLPGSLAHRGYSVSRVVAHLYKGTEGIYGIPVGVVATFVFHFVLFGVHGAADRPGASCSSTSRPSRRAATRRRAGQGERGVVGPVRHDQRQPIANAVTTGVMTIPLMKRVGFSARFAGAMEASASCGGQITPPIMGASAFVMAETLNIPYKELAVVAIVPALMHYVAILTMVHLEAKRLKPAGGMPGHEIPSIGLVLRAAGTCSSRWWRW